MPGCAAFTSGWTSTESSRLLGRLGFKRRRDRRAAARAVQPASAVQAVLADASLSPARASSQETIIIPPAMYVRDPAASAERRSLSLGMVRRVERRSKLTGVPGDVRAGDSSS